MHTDPHFLKKRNAPNCPLNAFCNFLLTLLYYNQHFVIFFERKCTLTPILHRVGAARLMFGTLTARRPYLFNDFV